MADLSLVLCAHPDDEIIGVGGTIAKFKEEGRKVVTVIFSYGERSHPWLRKEVTVRTRIKESKRAGRLVGTAELFFLAIPDSKIHEVVNSNHINMVVQRFVKKYNPDRIFTHTNDDPLPDHRGVCELVQKVAAEINYKNPIYGFEIWNPVKIMHRNKPRFVVDISKTFSRKMKALRCFESQKVSLFQLIPGTYLRAVFNGWSNRTKYAEVFYKLR